MKDLKFLAFSVFAFCSSYFCVVASPTIQEEVTFMAQEALQRFHVPGVAIGLVVDGQILLAEGFGLRDKSLPVTAHTLFPIASCTKAFTATVLGQLVDEGMVSWDDPVVKFIPEFRLMDSDRSGRLTIRDLLAHRTGIARHDPIWFFSETPRGLSRSALLERIKYLDSAWDSPSQPEFQYNNVMYAIAGIVIERVLNQTWEEAISARLLTPLGMSNSNMSIEDLRSSEDFSLPFAEIKDQVEAISFRDCFAVNPGSGINSNILDLLEWVQLQLSDGKNILQPATLKELHTQQISLPYKKEDIYQTSYGLGWYRGSFRGYDWVSHAGGIDGFSSEVCFLPSQKIGLVILSNSSSTGSYVVSCLRNQILDKLLAVNKRDWLSEFQKVYEKNREAARQAQRIFYKNTQKIPSKASLQPYVGFYEHPAYGVLELKIEENHLIAKWGKMVTPLYYKTDKVFSAELVELLVYKFVSIIDFTFFQNSAQEIDKVEIPFESFRTVAPITFIKKV